MKRRWYTYIIVCREDQYSPYIRTSRALARGTYNYLRNKHPGAPVLV